MRALTFHGRRDVRVDEVPDPVIQEPTDAIVRVTSTAICGSDLHLYELFGPFIDAGDILGHEPMGIVEAVGNDVTNIAPGDRVVVPFNISCGHCYMCEHNLYSQCETTQVREYGTGASLLGYTKLYGQVPGGQAEYVRVPQAQFGPVKVPDGPPDEQFLFLSDVLPTAWQAVEYAAIPKDGTVLVLGLGPIGQMSARVARHRGARAIGVDIVPERREMARRHGVEVMDPTEFDDFAAAVRDRTDGRGPDSVIDAVGMEAHGSPGASTAQRLVGLLPDRVAAPLMQKAGHRSPRRAPPRDRTRAARRNDLDQRRLRRCARSDADVPTVRQRRDPADGPGERARVDRCAAAISCSTSPTRSACST